MSDLREIKKELEAQKENLKSYVEALDSSLKQIEEKIAVFPGCPVILKHLLVIGSHLLHILHIIQETSETFRKSGRRKRR